MPVPSKRPTSVPPTIWSEFEGKKVVNGAKRKYWITDVTEDLYEEVIGHMSTGFLADEPLSRYTNFLDDKESVEEMTRLYWQMFKQNLGLVCFTKDENGKNKIAAINCTILEERDDHEIYIPKGKKWTVIYGILNYMTVHKDFFKCYNYDKYLSAMGLYVLPEFRGEGLGLEMLKAREPLCKAVGIPASCTVFTAIASQTLATRAGFQEHLEVPYDEMVKRNPNWFIPKIQEHTKSCKYMVKIYE